MPRKRLYIHPIQSGRGGWQPSLYKQHAKGTAADERESQAVFEEQRVPDETRTAPPDFFGSFSRKDAAPLARNRPFGNLRPRFHRHNRERVFWSRFVQQQISTSELIVRQSSLSCRMEGEKGGNQGAIPNGRLHRGSQNASQCELSFPGSNNLLCPHPTPPFFFFFSCRRYNF